MISGFEAMTKEVKEHISSVFDVFLTDRQILVSAVLLLMLDSGKYDFTFSRPVLDSVVSYGIKYSFDKEEDELRVSVVFPDEVKRMEEDE